MEHEMIKETIISNGGKYRSYMTRKWGDEDMQVFVLLNPRTVNADQDDAMIQRCIFLAKREGAGGLIVVNLFGLISTDTELLDGHFDPIGNIYNEKGIESAIQHAKRTKQPIICAWGESEYAEEQSMAFCKQAQKNKIKLICFGTTESGAPRQPLLVSDDEKLVEYNHKNCQ